MKRIKNPLVDIFWLMLAAIPMILVGLVFEIAAVYLGFVLFAAFLFRSEALAYLFAGIGAAFGAGAILLCVRCVNRRSRPQSLNSLIPTTVGPPESE